MPIDTYLEKSTLNAIDTVIKKGDKWKLIELLKIFDNSIIDINYTSDQEIYITTQDKSILSLSSFGDGLKKAIVLISKVMDAYNGVLLIDEIENGIHKDVLGKIFNEVIRNSKEYNTQIVATTHSREALEAILENLEHNLDDIAPVSYTHLYNKIGVEHEYDYIVRNKNEIKDVFEENLEWDIHLYKNAIIPIITNNEVKDVFPNKKGESSVVLLLSKIIRENISNLNLKEDDIIYFEKEEFNKLLLDLRKENGHGFTKTLREYSDELYIHTIKEYMKSFSMLDIKDNLFLILPLMGKIIGFLLYTSDLYG